MKRQDGPISDEMVDAYREVLAIKAAVAPLNKPSTPGAGVDPMRRVRPGKRLRNWHRAPTYGIPQISLKRYARNLAASEGTTETSVRSRQIAQRWLASKGVRP